MAIFIVSIVLMLLIDSFLVGTTFYALKNRFQWNISFFTGFIILYLSFVFIDNYLWPMIKVLDITYSVGNQEIVKAFNLSSRESAVDLFGFGLFEFVTWAIEALLASYFGEKIFSRKTGKTI
jgi:hypothetical protein